MLSFVNIIERIDSETTNRDRPPSQWFVLPHPCLGIPKVGDCPRAPCGVLNLADLNFSLNLIQNYKNASENMESDLQKSMQLIKNADHLVFIYPNWWGTMPALL